MRLISLFNNVKYSATYLDGSPEASIKAIHRHDQHLGLNLVIMVFKYELQKQEETSRPVCNGPLDQLSLRELLCVCMPVFLCVRVCMCMSVSVCTCLSLCICMCACLSVCLSACVIL